MNLDADKYYESLRFNHYYSGGTCEQRTLVLRVRFDNILEDITAAEYIANKATCHNYDETNRNFYVKKLEFIYKKFNIKEKERREFENLRKFLNRIQHSEIIAEEGDYIISLKTLCKLISVCSRTQIPEDLSTISPKEKDVATSASKEKKRNANRLPVSVVIDTTNINEPIYLNECIGNFVYQITENGLDINLSLFYIGNKGYKFVKPLENTEETYMNDEIESSTNSVIEKSTDFLMDSLNSTLTVKKLERNINSLLFLLLSSKTLKHIKPLEELEAIRKQNDVTIFPIGLDGNIDRNIFAKISPNREVQILSNAKYSELFQWIADCIKVCCRK